MPIATDIAFAHITGLALKIHEHSFFTLTANETDDVKSLEGFVYFINNSLAFFRRQALPGATLARIASASS